MCTSFCSGPGPSVITLARQFATQTVDCRLARMIIDYSFNCRSFEKSTRKDSPRLPQGDIDGKLSLLKGGRRENICVYVIRMLWFWDTEILGKSWCQDCGVKYVALTRILPCHGRLPRKSWKVANFPWQITNFGGICEYFSLNLLVMSSEVSENSKEKYS